MAPVDASVVLAEATTLVTRSIGSHLQRDAFITLILPIVATASVIARIWLRKKADIALKWDDLLIVLAIPFAWGLWGTWLYTCERIIGPGTVSEMPLTHLEDFIKACFSLEFIYVNGCNIIKFSILLFYLRCFGTDQRARNVLYAYFAVLAVYWIVRNLLTFLQCTPFSYIWEKIYPDAEGHCVNFRSLYVSTASMNLLTDIAIISFPLPIVWKLQIPLVQKLALCMVFCMGLLACLAGALRVYFTAAIFGADSSSLLDDDAVPKLHFSSLFELNIGMLTASLPASRAPLLALTKSWRASLLFRRPGPSTHRSSSAGPSPHGAGNSTSDAASPPDKELAIATAASVVTTPDGASPCSWRSFDSDEAMEKATLRDERAWPYRSRFLFSDCESDKAPDT